MSVSATRDVETLSAIHATSFPDSWTALFFNALLVQPGVVALAGPENEPAGFVLFRVALDEAEILTFAVRPEHRHHGFGQTLLNAAIDYVRQQNVTRCFLEVAVDNASAISLYARCGFVTCGRRKEYYQRESGQIDALMMERLLHHETVKIR